MYHIFTNWFTPWLYDKQIEEISSNAKLYNEKSIFGVTRTKEKILNNTFNGEAIEYHFINVMKAQGKFCDKEKNNKWLDIWLNGKLIEFKTFKDFIPNVPEIIDHFVKCPSYKKSSELWMFHRRGEWNNINLQYKLFFVYDLTNNQYLYNSKENKKEILNYVSNKLTGRKYGILY
jgi:hypothetical protein